MEEGDCVSEAAGDVSIGAGRGKETYFSTSMLPNVREIRRTSRSLGEAESARRRASMSSTLVRLAGEFTRKGFN